MKKYKIISFMAKTYNQLQLAYLSLRTRYKKSVQLKASPIGGSLFNGWFEIGQ